MDYGIKNTVFCTVAWIFIFANLLYLVLNFIELHGLIFENSGKDYPFGSEHAGWIYKDKLTYIKYITTWATWFLILLLMQVVFAFKNNKLLVVMFNMLMLASIIAMSITNGVSE